MTLTLHAFAPTALLAMLLLAPVPSAAQDTLPDAPGKATVAETCTGCHDLGPILAQRRSTEDWADVVERMTGFGATLSDAQKATILGYLNAALGRGDAPPAGPAPTSPGGR